MITGKYKELYDELLKTIPSGRVYHDHPPETTSGA